MTDDPVVVRNGREIAALPEDTQALKGVSLGSDDLEDIGRLSGLRCVYLDGCFDLDDRALALLSRLPLLEELFVSGDGITDQGLGVLRACEKLSVLGLDATIDGSGFHDMEGMPSLSEIHLPSCPTLSMEHLAHLSGFPALRRLFFYSVTRLSDLWLIPLMGSSGLEMLGLVNCPGVTEGGIRTFRTALPNCEVNRQ